MPRKKTNEKPEDKEEVKEVEATPKSGEVECVALIDFTSPKGFCVAGKPYTFQSSYVQYLKRMGLAK